MRTVLFRWLKRIGIFALVVLLVVLAVPRIALYRQIWGARADKLPLTGSELEEQIHVADADNAADLYRQAAQELSLPAGFYRQKLIYDAAIISTSSPAMTDTCRQLLVHYTDGMKVAELAAQKPGLDFHRNWDAGYNMTMPELESMEFMVALECIQAEIGVATKQDRDVLRHLRFAEDITRHIGMEPDFQADMAAVKSQSEIDRAMVRIIEMGNCPPALLADLSTLLSSIPPRKGLGFYAQGELVMDLATIKALPTLSDDQYEDLLSSIPSETEKASTKHLLQIRLMNPIYQAEFIGYYHRVISTMPKSTSDWKASSAAGELADRLSSDQTIFSLGNALFIKPIYGFYCSDEKAIARTRLAETALRLESDDIAKGRLPQGLNALGKCRVDPFSGEDFQYQPKGRGFKVFSVGQTGRSDGNFATDNMVIFVPNIAQVAPVAQG